MDTVTQQGWTYLAVFFVSDEFPHEEIYCALKYCHIIQKGHKADFFDTLLQAAVDVSAEANANVQQNINPAVFSFGTQAKDIIFVRNQGL